MKVEARIFLGIAVFVFLVMIVYIAWTAADSSYGVEPVGTAALALSGGMCMVIGTYFAFVHRRIPPRPEDRPDGEVEEGAGVQGFFSPGSYWPVAVATATGFAAVALAYFFIWLMVIAVVMLLLTIGGLVFEYHSAGKDVTR